MPTPRDHALAIWRAAVAAADPFGRVRAFLAADDGPARRALAAGGGVFVFGGGKAGPSMGRGVESALAGHLDCVSGVVNVPAGELPKLERIHLWPARPAGSNHPTKEGVAGVEMQLALTELLRPEDLALCLFSGGGSALLPAPVEGVSLEDKQELTRLLHASGATIGEMNCVRKHLSRFKGGRLGEVFAQRGCPAVSLLVSDVVGDPPDVIASGPTAPDPTTFADALAVLDRYGLTGRAPAAALAHLRAGAAGDVPETPKSLPEAVENVILCNNAGSLAAAAQKAEQLGYHVLNLGSFIEGETRPVATALAGVVRSVRRDRVPIRPAACLLSGGETTVSLGPGHGKGGRNQEFVLALLEKLGEAESEGVVVLSGGTDGEDGPTDAAGAVADRETWRKAAGRSLSPAAFLDRHDAYAFFEATGDLLRTGLTDTNVMDVRVVLVV
jgi:hydroxypyruvate reductase/glycerate 2-kinase